MNSLTMSQWKVLLLPLGAHRLCTASEGHDSKFLPFSLPRCSTTPGACGHLNFLPRWLSHWASTMCPWMLTCACPLGISYPAEIVFVSVADILCSLTFLTSLFIRHIEGLRSWTHLNNVEWNDIRRNSNGTRALEDGDCWRACSHSAWTMWSWEATNDCGFSWSHWRMSK